MKTLSREEGERHRANLMHHVERLERDSDALEEAGRDLHRKARALREDALKVRAWLTVLGLAMAPDDEAPTGGAP